MDNGNEPIADSELLYRRVPASLGWYDPITNVLGPQAFGPHKERDETGISVSRNKYKSVEDAARGRPGKSYYVAVLCAGDLAKAGIRAEPRPIFGSNPDPSHTELPQLNAATRKHDATLEMQRALAQLCLRVEGPFATPPAE